MSTWLWLKLPLPSASEGGSVAAVVVSGEVGSIRGVYYSCRTGFVCLLPKKVRRRFVVVIVVVVFRIKVPRTLVDTLREVSEGGVIFLFPVPERPPYFYPFFGTLLVVLYMMVLFTLFLEPFDVSNGAVLLTAFAALSMAIVLLGALFVYSLWKMHKLEKRVQDSEMAVLQELSDQLAFVHNSDQWRALSRSLYQTNTLCKSVQRDVETAADDISELFFCADQLNRRQEATSRQLSRDVGMLQRDVSTLYFMMEDVYANDLDLDHDVNRSFVYTPVQHEDGDYPMIRGEAMC